MRIAMIASGEGANARYRVFDPAKALRERGHRVFASVFAEMRDPNALYDFDVVYGWRMHDEFFTRIARSLAERNVGFVWDNDDNLLALENKGTSNTRFFRGLSGRRIDADMQTLMQLADLVTTPSSGLADHYRERVDTDVRVIENYVDGIRPRPAPARPREVVIGWIAHMEHQTDIERLGLRDTFARLLDLHPHVHVLTVGCRLGLAHDRCHHIRRVRFDDLRDCIAQFDVGIAPIADTEFNRSRSSIKLKEYAAVGVPWLASPIGPYAGLGADEGGKLVGDDRWFEELDQIVRDDRGRRRLAKRGTKWARRQTIDHNVSVWEATLREAAERAGRRV